THRGKRGAVRSEERDVDAQVGGKLLERRLLLGLRRARGRQGILRKRRRHFIGLAPWALFAERSPEQARGKSKRRETREHRKVDTQIKAAHHSCALANTYPAPRTVTMRRGFFGSSSIAARMRDTCTSIERSKASSGSPLTKSIRVSRDSTRPAFSASATRSANW